MGECDPLTDKVSGAAIEVRRHLGLGLFEVLYSRALRHELGLRGVPFRFEQGVPVCYKGCELGDDLRLDLIVAGELIVELKAVEALLPIHEARLITHLKLTGLKRGLLLNFNVHLLKDGIKRLVR